jgi:FixJ family two-component response regulator
MPEMNGSDLFSELEKISQTLKVIYMSAYTTDFITRHLGKSEGVSFIEKPFTMPTFIKTVTRILRK